MLEGYYLKGDIEHIKQTFRALSRLVSCNCVALPAQARPAMAQLGLQDTEDVVELDLAKPNTGDNCGGDYCKTRPKTARSAEGPSTRTRL